MPEAITFGNFRVGIDEVRDIGVAPEHDSVLVELSRAFDVPPEDLGELVSAVAPSPRLQENIAPAETVLGDPAIQASMGYHGVDDEGNPWNAYTVGHDLVRRTGLQEAVVRPLMAPAKGEIPGYFTAGVLPGRVVRWMDRMGAVMTEVGEQTAVNRLLLVSADRTIRQGESPQVEPGTTEHHFMSHQLAPALGDTGLFRTVEMLRTGEKHGKIAAFAAAWHLRGTSDLRTDKVIVPTVAGNWMQTGAQLRSALQDLEPAFDANPANRQLWVASDAFPIGRTGQEPKETHQNPLSALGNIARGAKLLDELR